MTKILELNGYKYSREQFEGYTHRAIFILSVNAHWNNDKSINIYTDNSNREEVYNVINSRVVEEVISCTLEHWTTKEQDELTSQFLEETLKDL